MEIYYTYLTIGKCGRYYIGVSTKGTNPFDDNYFGSFTDKTFIPAKKILLRIHTTKRDAEKYESFLHSKNDCAKSPMFANKSNARYGGGFTTSQEGTNNSFWGKKHTKETIEICTGASVKWNSKKENREFLSDKLKKTYSNPDIRAKCGHSGKSNPRYDNTIYSFYNEKLSVQIKCSKFELRTKYPKLTSTDLSQITTQDCSRKGWRCDDELDLGDISI